MSHVVISFQERLVAVHPRTGERVWELETGVKEIYGQLCVEDERVLYVIKRKVLCADYRTGRLLWTAAIPFLRPRMLSCSGCIVLADIGEALALSLQDGSQLWHDKFPGYGLGGGAMAAPGVMAPIDLWK
jgi:outer membrane protein assembly factor BamB